MATLLEQRSQHIPMGYDTLRYSAPQFTNPWGGAASGSNVHGLYQTTLPPSSAPQTQPGSRNSSISAAYPSTAASSISPDTIQQARAIYGNGYGAHNAFAPSSSSRYSPEQYPTGGSYAAYDQQVPRRASYPVKPPLMGRDSFNDALDASQGMVAMSQDITPRNVYAPRHGSQDSYGFPTHSTNSSISSASGYPHYYHSSYTGSVDGSVTGSSITDYGSEAENSIGTRSIHANYPQEQASMMTQFNSKMSASAQKKHKCKICDKRFTRPSSLQTHMYSHTGEKPFACDFDGCGRHFSVVSNLRRHKKCHRNGTDRSSPEDDSMSHSAEL